MSSALIARERSRPALLSKHAPAQSAFTSHGWPRVCAHTTSCASNVNRWPVSSVCCAIRARVSASVKSPMRSDLAATLNGLPPAITSPELDRMRWSRMSRTPHSTTLCGKAAGRCS